MTVRFEKPQAKAFELHVGAGPYIMRLMRLEDAPENQWGEGIYWYWELYNTVEENGKMKLIAASFDENGKPWQWRERTSTKFGKNVKNGQIAGARMRAEALLKADLDDDEVDDLVDDPAASLVEKYAFGYLTLRTTDDNKTYLNLQAIEPYRRGMQAPIQRIEDTADDELPFDDGDDDDGLPS